MQFENPILFFICSLGVFNGLLVSIYFLFFSKQKRVPNLLFGLLTLFLTLRIGKSVYVIFTTREERDLLFIQIGLSACFLIGISLFYYLKSSLENRKVIPKPWKIHFATLVLIILSVGIVKPYETNLSFWNTFFVWFIYTVWGMYLLASIFIMKSTIQKSFKKGICTTSEYWLIAVLLANVLIYMAYIIGYFYLYLIGTITFSVVFYALLIFFVSKKNRETIFQDILEKYGMKRIENEEAQLLIDQLKLLMEEKELYKETDIKLQKLAKQIHISTHKLSQLLNDNLGKSFASFINDYRIEEAKRLLKENHKLTLEAIGFEAGFSSKSSFYATFKKVTGKTPSEFQKEFL
ncbi:MAG: AraC family transcriptional regulator [Flavobacteriaceae bacterium]